jgi:hypothetical protein
MCSSVQRENITTDGLIVYARRSKLKLERSLAALLRQIGCIYVCWRGQCLADRIPIRPPIPLPRAHCEAISNIHATLKSLAKESQQILYTILIRVLFGRSNFCRMDAVKSEHSI